MKTPRVLAPGVYSRDGLGKSIRESLVLVPPQVLRVQVPRRVLPQELQELLRVPQVPRREHP